MFPITDIYPPWRLHVLVRQLEMIAHYPSVFRLFPGLGDREEHLKEILQMIEDEVDRQAKEER